MEIKNGEYSFDFNKLIPMPEELNLTAGGLEDTAVASYYLSLDKTTQRKIEDKLYSTKEDFYKNYWNKYKERIDYFKNHSKELNETEESFDGKIEETDKKFDSLRELGKQYVNNIINYNHSTWYDWCCDHWGTKWNVKKNTEVYYDESNKEYEINFRTAWCSPYGIVKEFSKLCKNGELHWEYYDEDYDGDHVLTKENGKIIDTVYSYDEEIEEPDIDL